MRLAFIDLVFSWPPLGGAPADLYYTISGLQELGHEVHLFYSAEPGNWFLSDIDAGALPFSSTRLDFARGTEPETVAARYRTAVDAWGPDVVFQCFGFFLKPVITEALAHYPQIARYYAYEPFCPRDYRLFKDHTRCPQNYLRTPDVCRRCTASVMWRDMRSGHPNQYVSEYVQTRAYAPEYHALLARTLAQYKAVIVYNHMTQGLLEGFSDRVHVIGGGVHLEDFDYAPAPSRGPGEKTIIFMSGRADDASKGVAKLEAAGRLLAEKRNDFEIRVTHPDLGLETAWFKPLGWRDFKDIKKLYQDADICVAPSLWEEPFGLVAVEAMATGRPAVVSDVGGLQEIVTHGETGYVYPREDARALAGHLETLLDDAALRRRMGDAGRRRVEEEYDWKRVIAKHYPAMLEEALR